MSMVSVALPEAVPLASRTNNLRSATGDRTAAVDHFVSIPDDGTSSIGIAGVAAWRQLVERAAPGNARDHCRCTIRSVRRAADERDGDWGILTCRHEELRFSALEDAERPGARRQVIHDERRRFGEQVHGAVGRCHARCCCVGEGCASGSFAHESDDCAARHFGTNGQIHT
eukprot:5706840-Prymnesium_polylepis.1